MSSGNNDTRDPIAAAAATSIVVAAAVPATMETEARYTPYANSPKSTNGGALPSTIRTVPSYDAPSDSSSESPSARNSGFSSDLHSDASAASYTSQPQSQNRSAARSAQPSPTPPDSAMSSSSTTLHGGVRTLDPAAQMPDSAAVAADDPVQQWDSAVGKAALGKTGRVINKLVSDNEALKREIKVERMKAEEFKQTAKLMEDKIERMVAEYESRLLEASVTKTLLARKERQVETLQLAVENEKKRTADALDRERTWKEEMAKSRRDASVQVDEAKMQAALMEGRYNAIASHWKDQGDEVKRRADSLHGEIAALVIQRQQDDDKINTLRDLCDQQDGNIRDLRKQKDDIGRQFEAYKEEQENILRDIKQSARSREDEQQRTLEETKRVLGELRWALNVKQNVPGAG